MPRYNLTPREERFAQLVQTERSMTHAYMAAGYDCSKMVRGSINGAAHKLSLKPAVAARIKELRESGVERVIMSVAEVMQDWVDIATADPNEVVQHRRVNCRHCWGKKHGYQYKDKAEHDAKLAEVELFNAKLKRNATPQFAPPATGGYGFVRNLPPCPACPVCDGEGVGDVWAADTSRLTGKAAKLYAGVKMTKNGLEVLLHDQEAARTNLAKAFGMFTEKYKLVGGNTDGDDEASKFWRELQDRLPS